MCCKNLWKKVIPFILTLTFGLFASDISQKITAYNEGKSLMSKSYKIVINNTTEKESTDNFIPQGSGRAKCNGSGNSQTKSVKSIDKPVAEKNNVEITRVKIISKPQANYTNAGRDNQVQGVVKLNVVFLANGQIGSVSPINNLPYGLTEQAIEAARRIKFEPATRGGITVSVSKAVEYTFTIY